MRSCVPGMTSRLLRVPCTRCGRPSVFVTSQGLCPFCRGEDIEREAGLRPGLFRRLAVPPAVSPDMPGHPIKAGRRSCPAPVQAGRGRGS